MTRRTLARLGAAALAVGALTVGVAGNASAGPADTDPPVITFNDGMQFFAGSTLTTNDDTATLPARVSWSQFDPDGICDRRAALYLDNPSQERTVGIQPGDTTYTGSFAAAGYSELLMDTYDCAGNVDNEDFEPYNNLIQQNNFTLSAGWTTTSCTCWSHNGIVKSSKIGATASYSFYGSSAALIGVYGTGRGSAKVYLDGKLQTTVNENQPDPSKGMNRVVVYATKRLQATSHTIKIVTTTKARTDLDALLVSE